jgi:hypothetical protein
MATPLGMTAASTLSDAGATALDRKGWFRNKIYMESVKNDVYIGNKNLIHPLEIDSSTAKQKVSTDKMVIKVTAGKDGIDEGMKEVTLAMSLSLQNDAINGNASAYIGNEEQRRYQFATTYANDFANPLASFGFGIDKLAQNWLNVDKTDSALLSQWHGETKGLHVRQAYCETISENLEEAPISATAKFNPNMMLAEDLTSGTDVVNGIITYDSTVGTYDDNIVAAAVAATPADNHTTIAQIIELADVASQHFYIKPLMIDGKAMYKYVVAPEELRRLRNSTIADSYAKNYIDGSALARVSAIVPEAELVIGDIIVCQDIRNPTLQATGGNASFGYQLQGRRSSRHGTDYSAGTVATMNVNVLCGAESLVDFTRDMVDFREQDDDYGRNKGELIRECSGMTLPIFDNDTPTDTSVRYEGGLLVLTSRESNIGQ